MKYAQGRSLGVRITIQDSDLVQSHEDKILV